MGRGEMKTAALGSCSLIGNMCGQWRDFEPDQYSFLQTRLDEKEAAEKRATTSESEAAELSKRLVELKMGEIERMNEVSMLTRVSALLFGRLNICKGARQ